jgi:L-threonylcarbamoyladenylate synthase
MESHEASGASTVSERYDCSDPEQRAAGLKAAAEAVHRGELVVLPTDTVYGIGADAFSPAAVAGLLAAKGRGRDMPPPVLVGSVSAATALIEDLENIGRSMIDEFWPGGLTLVCRASRSLSWDLGDTKGTVAVRMPMHPLALDLLRETGPMAVTSANMSGSPAAVTADEAGEQLGDSVAVILDGGPATGGVPSTIVDVTGMMPRLLRAGAVSIEKLAAVALVAAESTERPAPDAAADAAPTSPSRSTAAVNGQEPPEEPR